MIRTGSRVKASDPWDHDAIEVAVKRMFFTGERGTVEDGPARTSGNAKITDTFLVHWDNGGSCFMNRGELEVATD